MFFVALFVADFFRFEDETFFIVIVSPREVCVVFFGRGKGGGGTPPTEAAAEVLVVVVFFFAFGGMSEMRIYKVAFSTVFCVPLGKGCFVLGYKTLNFIFLSRLSSLLGKNNHMLCKDTSYHLFLREEEV